MTRISEFIAKQTSGSSFKTNKMCLDWQLKTTVNYDREDQFSLYEYGETEFFKSPINIWPLSKQLKRNNVPPIFKFFLDGSRKTYKVDDIIYDKKVYPIIAGQIAVGCCKREDRRLQKEILTNNNVIALPIKADKDGIPGDLFFDELTKSLSSLDILKKRNISFSHVLSYKDENLEEGQRYENLGIARIQDEMIDIEKRTVVELANNNKLNHKTFLLKDGSIEYKKVKASNKNDISLIKKNFNYVIGASKSFNPEKCIDMKKKSNASVIAELPLYYRTPAYLFESKMSGNIPYAIWYVRIRDAKYSHSPFDGVLKLEKMLLTDSEIENGIETSLADHISANIINERTPVCYGNDDRWPNHLYPIYLTEKYIKSKFLSDEYFLNLF